MSFSKSEIKRFNEGAGCAPAVGSYDPRYNKKSAGGVIEKTERFKHPKDVGDDMQSALSLSNPSLCSTPIKGSSLLTNTSSSSEHSLVHSMSKKNPVKKPAQVGEHLSRIKELEMEIRRLLREKSDKDKELQRLRQEHERLDGRLNSANADRSSCLARSAQLEQEVRDTKRGLEVLQKQVSSTETCGRKKEDRLKEEVHSLQAQIQGKEREIQGTHRQVSQALLALLTDAQKWASHSEGLTQLFCRLELNADVTESEDDEKVAASYADSGLKEIDSQIKKVRRHIKRASRTISQLAESGVERVDVLQGRLEEQHGRRLQQVSEQLADTLVQHQQLSRRLSQQQEEHQQQLAETLQQRQEEYDRMQLEIRQLQQDCQQAQQHLEHTLQQHSAAQQQLQQSQEEHSAAQQALECRLREEQHATLEERRLLGAREVEEVQERLEEACEELMQKEGRLGELHSCLLENQEEHEAAQQTLQEEVKGLQEQLSVAQSDLQHRQLQHQEALQQLQQLQESSCQVQEELQESQECRSRMQEQVELLQQEERQLRKLVDSLQENRDTLEVEKEVTRKELELKGNLMTEAMQTLKGEAYTVRETGTPTKTKQVLFEEMAEKAGLEERILQLEEENATLDINIRALTAKFQDSILDLEAALVEERQKSDQMSAWISVSEEERGKMSDELNQTQMVNRDLVESLRIFRDEVSSLKSGSKDLKQQLEEERTATTSLKATLQDTQTQLEEERTVNADLQTAVGEAEKQQQDVKLANTDLQTAIKKAEERLEEEGATNTALEAAVRTTQKLLEQEKVAHMDLQAAIRKAEERLEEERATNADLEDVVRTTQNLLEQEKVAHTDLQASARDMNEQLEVEKTSSTQLQTALREAQSRVEERGVAHTHLCAQVKTLQLKLQEQQSSSDAASREAQTRVDQLEVETKQHHIANLALKGQLTQLTEQHNKQREHLQRKCQSLAQERQQLGKKHQDDLQSVKRALALDRQANDLQMEELNMKLDRAQAFNSQLKEEMKKLLKDKEKLKDDCQAEVTALQVVVEAAEAKVTETSSQSDVLRHQAKHAQAEWLRLKSRAEELAGQLRVREEEAGSLQGILQECHSTMALHEDRLGELIAEKESLEEHLNRLSGEHSLLETDLEKQLQIVQAAALEEREDYEKMISEMSEKIQQLEGQLEQLTEKDDDEWQQKYEALFARVEPFLEQLDAYAAEKNFLVGRSQLAEVEMSRMMDKYAKLLGHQNQKQKIQYINKLKDEFMQCRKEKDTIKEKSNKQQNTIQKLEKKIQALEGRKAFEPSQAFKHPNAAAAKKDDSVVPKTSTPLSLSKPGDRKGLVRGQEEVVRSPLKQSNK